MNPELSPIRFVGFNFGSIHASFADVLLIGTLCFGAAFVEVHEMRDSRQNSSVVEVVFMLEIFLKHNQHAVSSAAALPPEVPHKDRCDLHHILTGRPPDRVSPAVVNSVAIDAVCNAFEELLKHRGRTESHDRVCSPRVQFVVIWAQGHQHKGHGKYTVNNYQ